MKTIIKNTAIISVVFLAIMFSAHSSSKLERIGEPLSIKTVDEKLIWQNITSLLVDKNIIYSTFITQKKKKMIIPVLNIKK